MGFAISKYWGQSPWWFDQLGKNEKLLLIADYQLTHTDQKEKKKSNRNNVIERVRKRREEINSQGAMYGHKNNKHSK